MDADLVIEVELDKRAAAARFRLYEWFSKAFNYPENEEHLRLISEGNHTGIMRLIGGLPYFVNLSDVQLPTFGIYTIEEIRKRYTNLFNSGKADTVLLNESEFSDSPRSIIWEDLIRFYEYFGLNYDGEKTKEWPDSLILQLECMQYLSFLQVGIKQDVRSIIQAQKDFVERHISNWLPMLTKKLEKIDYAAPYKQLVALLRICLDGDLKYLKNELGQDVQ